MNRFDSVPTLAKRLVLVAALAGIYIVTARLGLLLALPPEKKATAVWPPSGIALAALLLFGYRLWPGIWLGAFVANFIDYFSPGNPFSLTAHFAVSFAIGVGSTLQAVVGTFLVKRWTGSRDPLDRLQDVIRFLYAGILMCLIACTFGVTSVCLTGFAPWSAFGFVWWTWWLGDAAGVFIVTPLLLTWTKPPARKGGMGRFAEAGLILLLLFSVGMLVFGSRSPLNMVNSPMAYLSIPLLIWATLRFGNHGAVTALTILSGVAVWGTANNFGPFVQATLTESLLLLQAFMGVITVTTLALSAVLTERQAAEARLEQSRQRLALALEGGNMGSWDWEVASGKVTWSATLEAIHGLPAGTFGGTFDDYLQTIYGEDRARVLNTIAAALPAGPRFFIEYRAVRGDGKVPWMEGRGLVVRDQAGKAIRMTGVCTDISERKQAEENLRESESKFRQLADAMPQIVWTSRPDGYLDYYNDRWYEFTGMPRSGGDESWKPVLHPDDVQMCLDTWYAAVRSGQPYQIEYRFKDVARGVYRWHLGRAMPIRDSTGAIVRWFGTCTDVDELKRFQVASRESEEKYRALAETIPALVWSTLPDGCNDFLNRRWLEYTGLSDEASRGDGWIAVLHPEDRARTGERWTHSLRTGEPYQIEYRIRGATDGAYRWFVVHALPVRDESGQIVRWFGASVDIEDQKRAEEKLWELNATLERRIAERSAAAEERAAALVVSQAELRQKNAELQGIFFAFPDIYFWVDPDGTIRNFHAGMKTYVPPEQFLNRRMQEILPSEIGSKISEALARAIETASVIEIEYPLQMEDGLHWFDARIAPLLGQQLLYIIRDISKRKEAETLLRVSLEEKEVLLKEIHHRVKNNLQVISSFLSLQSGYVTDPQAAALLQESEQRVRSMALIHETLYRSTNLGRLDFADYARELAMHLFHFYRPQAGRVQLRTDLKPVFLNIDTAIPCGLILNELVSNCLKHAFPGERSGTVAIELLTLENGYNQLIVRDDGIGFPEGIDWERTHSLGMRIVRLLARQLGGDLEFPRVSGGAVVRLIFRPGKSTEGE